MRYIEKSESSMTVDLTNFPELSTGGGGGIHAPKYIFWYISSREQFVFISSPEKFVLLLSIFLKVQNIG